MNDALREALRPLAAIYEAWLVNGLDEDRPYWRMNGIGGAPPLEEVQLFAGRGGKQLLTLADAKAAYDALKPVEDFTDAATTAGLEAALNDGRPKLKGVP